MAFPSTCLCAINLLLLSPRNPITEFNPRGFNSEILLLITSEKDPIAQCGHFHWSLGLGLGHTLQGALLPTLPVLHIRATNVTLGSLSLELPQAIIWKI